ncbi:MAG TPA: galactokinase [Solirubrobacteraceae bacterium]|nr:galactokinase [Solirubrobacteraceae bacterium]
MFVPTYPTLSPRVAHAFAPGRVNLIGEHTDYNDGWALPFAISAGVTVTATELPGSRVEVRAHDLRQRDSFDAGSPDPNRGWRAFARGVVAELAAGGISIPGARIEISGDVPRGSGLSSSAALAVSLTLALAELASAEHLEKLDVARLCQRVENNWIGAQTGLLDQLAALYGSSGHAVLIDFRELSVESVPLVLGQHRLVALHSGESHANSASGYNQRRRECAEAAHRMGAPTLRDALIQDLHMLPDVLARRARHVIAENGRVLQAVEALRQGDLETLGRLLDASHASLRDEFEVSTDAVEESVARLKRAGALGARLLGGGFGGTVLGLMPPDATAPPGSIEVAPSQGARLLPATPLP